MIADVRARAGGRSGPDLRDRRVQRRPDVLSPRLRERRPVPGGCARHRQYGNG
jgi:hypothetical protein